MPQSATKQAKDPSQDYTAVDPQQNPAAFIFQNRDAISRMPEEKQLRFIDMAFRRYALPKYQRMNKQTLTPEDIDNLRLQFAARMLDVPFEPVEQKGPKPTVSMGERAEAAFQGLTSPLRSPVAYGKGIAAGTVGGIKTIEELAAKIDKQLGKIPGIGGAFEKAGKQFESDVARHGALEGRLFEGGQKRDPLAADVGAAAGHQLPATLAAEGASGLVRGIPAVSRGAKALRHVTSGAAGGVGFEAARPGGDIGAGAKWGAIFSLAFPILGKLFGLGRRATGAVTEEAAPAVADTAGAAKVSAATAAPKTFNDLAEIVAQKKFGKAFKDLSPSERSQVPSGVKDEILSQRAAKQAAGEAKKTAIRTGKAEAAKAKATAQAAERAKTGTPTSKPASKTVAQATATQAVTENPQVSKIMEAPGYEGAERRVAGKITEPPAGQAERRKSVFEMSSMSQPTEGEKLAADIRASSSPSHNITEGEARAHIMKDASLYEKFKAAAPKDQDKMLVDAKNELLKVKKVPAGETGPKVRAKGGKPASPAQQAADRERAAKTRAEAKSQEFGAALEKHAQQMSGRFVGKTVGIEHIPELEDAAREFEGGDIILSALQKMRRAKKMTDEMYASSLVEWMKKQFEGKPAAD